MTRRLHGTAGDRVPTVVEPVSWTGGQAARQGGTTSNITAKSHGRTMEIAMHPIPDDPAADVAWGTLSGDKLGSLLPLVSALSR